MTEIEILSSKIAEMAEKYRMTLAEATRIVLKNYTIAKRLGLYAC